MYIGFTPEQDAMRHELRSYYEALLTPEVRAELAGSEGAGPAAQRIVQQMAADGWLGIGWPVEYGGQGRTPIEQFIFYDESMRAGAPVPMLTINSVAPTIMNFGTQEQKDFFLPKILAGEITFCIGYTEPESGTDLGSLKTRATRDGDEYVINGQKVFTSLATTADYVWLAVRTDPETTNHKGISIVIVPTDTPGFKVTPIENMGQMDTTITYYEDVRVPVANLVGEEHHGWRLITNQLNHERVTLCSSGIIERHYEAVSNWAKTTTLADGRRVIDQPWVQLALARVHANLEFLRLINFEVAWETEKELPLDPAAASSVKVFGTEFYLEALRLLQEVVGPAANVRAGQAGTVLDDRLGAMLRSTHILTFGGGTNELPTAT